MEPFLLPESTKQQEDTGSYFEYNSRLTHAPPPSPVSHSAKETVAAEKPQLDHKLVCKAIKKVKKRGIWKCNKKTVKANLKKTLKKFEQLGLTGNIARK